MDKDRDIRYLEARTNRPAIVFARQRSCLFFLVLTVAGRLATIDGSKITYGPGYCIIEAETKKRCKSGVEGDIDCARLFR